MAISWGWFTGEDKAKRQATETYNQNATQLKAGYGNMKDAYGQGYTSATGRLSPYSQQGRNALSQYGNFLGLNGEDAQKGALGAYQKYNPYWNANADRMLQTVDRRSAATGQLGSGMNALARARVADEQANRDYMNYLSMLQGQAGMGLGVDSSLAGLDMTNAGNLAGVEQWFRGGNISNQTNAGNALAAAHISPLNYMMQNAQMAISAMSGKPMSVGSGGANSAPVGSTGGTYNPGPYAGYGLYM